MLKRKQVRLISLYLASGLPPILSHPALAGTAGVTSVESFMKSVITVIVSLAGLIATGFFVIGGISYIISSGNPEHLAKAKRTILYSGVGLAITIAAFVLSNIVTSLATKAFGS